MKGKISNVMWAAITLAKDNGGKLRKYPGGFWAEPGLPDAAQSTGFWRERAWYGTSTVAAIVERSLANYTDHRSVSGGGSFPVEITIKEL